MNLGEVSVKQICDAHSWVPIHTLAIGNSGCVWLPAVVLESRIADIIAHCAAKMEASLLGARVDRPRDLERIVKLTLLKVCLNGLLAARDMKHGAEPIDVAESVADADNGSADQGTEEVHDAGQDDAEPVAEPEKVDNDIQGAG